ncbi:hypothetical protein [Pyxidicoccus fallax]|nr:hypothetical protein [Pyxidicoccus fallax]
MQTLVAESAVCAKCLGPPRPEGAAVPHPTNIKLAVSNHTA